MAKEAIAKIVNQNKWNPTDYRYVGYIDIMGFKDMVARSSHDEIYQMMRKIEERRKFSENIKWGDTDSKLVRTTTYSDSIMVYSKDSSYESLRSFVCTIASLTSDLFLMEIPHKGAFSFGEMTLDTENSIFFGQPLIDAYLLQDEINFYGIVAHSSAEKAMSKNKSMTWTADYLCPFKNGASNHLIIYPMSVYLWKDSTKDQIKMHNDLFLSLKKLRHITSGHLRKYIDNTELMFNKIKTDTEKTTMKANN